MTEKKKLLDSVYEVNEGLLNEKRKTATRAEEVFYTLFDNTSKSVFSADVTAEWIASTSG
ncbi:UNVERIFIED_CONTAM: hypothetical protein Slati_4565500 [Sesamum latifolium]|uniref:Uncharacterized protein n=1 Tax=Sesamum latifolium TaxID=2727402 RepID=A0AAW2SG70_9LAMI